MPEDNERLEDHLTDIFRRLTDTPEGAAHGARVTYAKHGLTAADIRVMVLKGTTSNLLSLVAENRDLRAQIHRLRGAKGLTWADFVGACSTRIDVKAPGWRRVIATKLGFTVNGLAEWERQDRVPYSLLARIEALPDLQTEPLPRSPQVARTVQSVVKAMRAGGATANQIPAWLAQLVALSDEATLTKLIEQALSEPAPEPKPKPKQQRVKTKPNATPVFWTPETYQTALKMLIEQNATGPEVAAHFGIKLGPFWSKFKNREPDEDLLGAPITVHSDGPMDVLELWRIGYDLYGLGWRNKIEKLFDLGGRVILFSAPSEVLTEDQMLVLRGYWQMKMAEKPAEQPDKPKAKGKPKAKLSLSDLAPSPRNDPRSRSQGHDDQG